MIGILMSYWKGMIAINWDYIWMMASMVPNPQNGGDLWNMVAI